MVDFSPEYRRQLEDEELFGLNAPRFQEYHGAPIPEPGLVQKATYRTLQHRFVALTEELMWREYWAQKGHGDIDAALPRSAEGPRGHEQEKSARERRIEENRRHNRS